MLKETTNKPIQDEQPNLVSSFNSGLEVNVAHNHKHEKTPNCLYISNAAVDVLTQELVINHHSGVALTPVKLNCEYSSLSPNLIYTMYLNPAGGSTATNFIQCPYFPVNGENQVSGQLPAATEGYQSFTGISQTRELLNSANNAINVTEVDSTCDILETALQQCVSSISTQPQPEIQGVCAYPAAYDNQRGGCQGQQVVYSLNNLTTLCNAGTGQHQQQQNQIQQLKQQLQQQLNCSQKDAVNTCNNSTGVEEESECVKAEKKKLRNRLASRKCRARFKQKLNDYQKIAEHKTRECCMLRNLLKKMCPGIDVDSVVPHTQDYVSM